MSIIFNCLKCEGLINAAVVIVSSLLMLCHNTCAYNVSHMIDYLKLLCSAEQVQKI